MKALDTNIIIRFLVNDDKKQGEAVKSLFLKTEKKGGSFFVSSVVLLEIIYVLGSVYSFSRSDILDAVDSMLSMSVLSFEHTVAIQNLISIGNKTSVELEYLFIGSIGTESDCISTITFDKKAVKSDLFELLV